MLYILLLHSTATNAHYVDYGTLNSYGKLKLFGMKFVAKLQRYYYECIWITINVCKLYIYKYNLINSRKM